MPSFSLFDIRFLLSRVNTSWLPEENGGVAPLGPTGIRNVQGVANNTTNPASPNWWFGAADTLFPRLTFNRLTNSLTKNDTISAPFANATRLSSQITLIGATSGTGLSTKDSLNPRNISNLVADSSAPVGFQSLDPADPNYARKLAFKLQDNPAGRISPLSGAINALPYSNWMSQFGQFFDHGLDFVAKGVDGKARVSLMPGDSLYSRTQTLTASRSNTANITVGAGSSDALLNLMGIDTTQQDTPSWQAISTLTNPGTPASGALAYEGTLVLNNTLITIGARDVEDLVAQINFQAPTTGVTASATPFPVIPGVTTAGTYQLVLTPAKAESFNQTSPFIDLSQNYGSDNSRTLFVREYLDANTWKAALPANANLNPTVTDLTTGRLLNAGATVNGETKAGMANWNLVKANALRLGITLHDKDITAIPLVAFGANEQLILDANGMPQLVALNKITGAQVYVKNTDLASDTVIQGLVTASAGTLTAADFVLMATKHAFLNDMAPAALAGSGLPPGVSVTDIATGATNIAGFTQADFVLSATGDNPANYSAAMQAYFNQFAPGATFQPLNAHYIAGDGRLNENIGLTAVHEVFLTEHNRVLTLIKQQYGFTGEQPQGGWSWTDPLTNQASTISGEDLFQAAKLVVEMEYQHMVFAEFSRKLSPNIAGFAGVNPLIDARISSEFANAVYRLGHSMLPEAVGMRKLTDAASFSTTLGSPVIRVTMTNHGLNSGTNVVIAGVNAAIGGVAATALNGTFAITRIDANTFTYQATAAATAAATGLATDKVQIDINKGLIDAFLSPTTLVPGSTSALLATGSAAQVANRIDEKVTDAMRDNLLGQPLDLATLNLIRGRDAGIPTLNEMRRGIQPLAPALLQPTLTPYTSWSNFAANLKGSVADQTATVKNFMMAYASDELLTQFAAQARTAAGAVASSFTTLSQWYALRESTVQADRDAYMNGLRAAANAAFANATWMGTAGNKGFERIDAWIGGLAEKEVVGGMLGSTFDAVFAMQMMNLQNGDQFYYLGRIPATEFFNENIDGSLISDLVARSTGATHLYSDIFSVADQYVEMGDLSQATTFTSLNNLQRATTTQSVLDINGNVVTGAIGRAGFVNGIFYGNTGNYTDARGVLNPNGIGNASEMIGGRAVADNIRAGGGNDTVWADGGNDTVDGGSGVDYLHGGDGNDSIVGGADGDFLYGDLGADTVRGGLGIDTLFGNEDNDVLFGGADADAMIGGPGNDLMYGGDGVVVNGILDPEPAVAVALVDDGMFGGQGDDTLYGGGGWDSLDGESGHDVLIPGAGGVAQGGRDVMNGAQGDDLYIIESDLDFANQDIADTGLSEQQLVNKGAGFRIGNGLGIDEVRFTQNVAANIVIAGTNNLGVASIFTGVERVVIGTGLGATANTTGTAAINIDASLADPGLPLGLPLGLTMVGNAGPNALIGTAFNDVLDGGLGVDTMEGGLGDDTYVIDATTDVLDELTGGGVDTIVVNGAFNYSLDALDPTVVGQFENLTLQSTALQGTGNDLNNVILGNASNNTLLGLGGDDSINGGGGNDTIDGGAGVDSLAGGLGADTFTFSSVADIGNDPTNRETIMDFQNNLDILNFSPIDANITVAGTQTFSYIGTVDRFTAPGQLRYWQGVLYGNVDANVGDDFQIALAGITTFSDTTFAPSISITSNNGAGVAEGDTTNSLHSFTVAISQAQNTDTVLNWAVSGTATNPVNSADFGLLTGLPTGTVTIPAGATSASFNVTVVGDTTFEQNEGLQVSLTGVPATFLVANGTATSTVLNDDGQTINGTANGETLNGTALNDIINGLGGRDTLNGNGGNDIINGGNERDQMTGGAGADTFLFGLVTDSPDGNRDTITDFVSGTDKIDLSQIDADGNATNGDTAFIFIGTAAFSAPAQVRFANGLLQMNTTGTGVAEMGVNLTGVTTLVATDFIL